MCGQHALLPGAGASLRTRHTRYFAVSAEGPNAWQETEYSLMHPPGTLQSHKYWKSLPTLLVPELGNCLVTITNSLKTRSYLHRAVVSGIMVSADLGFIDTHKWCPECLPLTGPMYPGVGG